MLTLSEIRAVPKVLLHDHLDGGLRPQTVLELARETGYRDLPGDNVEELTQRLTEGAHRGHLEVYLDAFRHTVAVMQTADALRRVAAECAEDLAADGVVYAEVRFAPELHTERGLSLDQVVEAVLEGFTPYGRSASNARTRLMMRAVHSGLPVVRVGRGNTEGFVPLDNPAFIGGSNLTATKARLLLMACLMKFGALPPAANPDQPTAEETAATHGKVAEYQAIFNTH